MNFGAYIRSRRQTAHLPLRKLAETIGVDPAYLSRVERGLAPPSDALIAAVANALGADPEELLLLAGRVPASWQDAIAAAPARAVESLRGALARSVAEPSAPYHHAVLAFAGTRAIEDPAFPFEHLSEIAELGSWRKEINRPVYHLHKWWAQRLGSVFRAILLGAFAPKGSNILEMFYQPARLPGAVVFDPFMGSGTTVGEALKLGARAIGRDINPVAHFAVRNALGRHSRQAVLDTFHTIDHDVAPKIRHFYQARLHSGSLVDVLYYFWVKVVPCPACTSSVDLFSSYVFAQHAYPTRYPDARALCPHCGAINLLAYNADHATCAACHTDFKPKAGPADGAKATCPKCRYTFPIARTVQKGGEPPRHRFYAKLVLRPDGSKAYLPIDDYDLALYEEAASLLGKQKEPYPLVRLTPGYNTDQVLNYGYTHWHQMFNDRQLLCLSLLVERIRSIPDERVRGLFACLFSGSLEFNNMFASFKGEGTGAVRHMFAHHILKPERTPLEANVWGTPKSSGAFSTLFQSRVLRALDYRESPFEVRVLHANGKLSGEKIHGLSCKLGHDTTNSFADFVGGNDLYLSCGDSATTDLDAESVDAVVTDPPFFDNVHYSQLADFFYVWQRHILGANGYQDADSTRSPAEVQQSDPATFVERLASVWAECHRVLRPGGLLVFTYHHSRAEGWRSVLEAVVRAGFGVVAAHPIKAEMSVAAPKRQAKSPIDLDVIFVCCKQTGAKAAVPEFSVVLDRARHAANQQVARFNGVGRRLGRNDVRVVLMAQVVRLLSPCSPLTQALESLDASQPFLETVIDQIHDGQRVAPRPTQDVGTQLQLW